MTKNCRVSVNLTLEEQTKLEKLANELDVSQSWVIRRAVQTYLETEINKSIPTNITRVKQACL
ncbi:ribbon-helix-helix protein, CopG family [Shewanella xiamenensis]|uniref:ribbon-helix-helix protein, CopG family n=1 Tax=Shewanella xiamenensis TaxID=332186 RepID=UPI00186594D7